MSGEMDQAKGRMKKAAGDLTGDRKTRREGKVDEGAGKAKGAIDKLKAKLSGRRRP